MAETFDEVELLDRVDNDLEFLGDTVSMLESDGPSLVEQIRQAIAAGDAPTVARHAHALKGMISNFCAARTQACALELERLGKAGDLSSAGPALTELELRLAALTGELVQFIKERK